MRTTLLFILAAAALAVPRGAGAQTTPTKEMTDAERALVAGSREAIIETGISPAFFDGHFRVARVVDRPGDRRVVWLLSVGGYEASVNDSVGFYTEGARRVDTHSVAATLSSTSDITRTITRRRAEALMRRCIGRFSDPQVEYRAHVAGGRAALLLTAHAPAPRRRQARVRGGREERGRARSDGAQSSDEVGAEDEGGEGPFVVLGAVDLVTGECTVGYGQAGPLPPARPFRRQR
ncbi:MAG: hypothetical protein JOZ02_06445 [Acidobacteria bacterium]|nr:hypothetical protein [Acidobacteriota bacterium]